MGENDAMKIIVCVDNNNGMMFNHRRQSQDKVLRKRILELTDGHELWMNSYSKKQFLQDIESNISNAQAENGNVDEIHADEDFLEKAGTGEYCFVEDEDVSAYGSRIEEVILCHWNRDYPADMYLRLDLSGYRLVETREYKGFSHEKITEERYVRK